MARIIQLELQLAKLAAQLFFDREMLLILPQHYVLFQLRLRAVDTKDSLPLTFTAAYAEALTRPFCGCSPVRVPLLFTLKADNVKTVYFTDPGGMEQHALRSLLLFEE